MRFENIAADQNHLTLRQFFSTAQLQTTKQALNSVSEIGNLRSIDLEQILISLLRKEAAPLKVSGKDKEQLAANI